jgi:hypothetical protein
LGNSKKFKNPSIELNTSKSAFTIENLINGTGYVLNDPLIANNLNNNSPTSISSNKENSEKNTNDNLKRNKTLTGLDNLPIPPPVVCPLTSSKNNATTTSSRPKASSPIPSTNSNNNPAHTNLNYQAAMAAAAAALFNPAALAPFLSPNNIKTATSLLVPQSISNQQQQTTDSLNLFRNQLFNRYNPFMNQLALAASLSNNNQATATTTEQATSTPASTPISNKIYGKS